MATMLTRRGAASRGGAVTARVLNLAKAHDIRDRRAGSSPSTISNQSSAICGSPGLGALDAAGRRNVD
ncbi:hypothetical protein [Prosthecobacter sp.]